jgi:2-polyprenyl-3-methyl-5-hydroxy-6-metoxy-1,4-benzoquinol methylase
MRTNYFEFGMTEPPIVDGLDAYEPNVRHARSLGVYRSIWSAELPCELTEDAYSTVLASEVLEHLPPEKIDTVLDELESAAKERVVVTTPNWSCLRKGAETFVGFNQFESHLSFISPERLALRGYSIQGAGIGNPRTTAARLLGRILGLLGITDSGALYSLSKRIPSIAHTIVAFKDV